MPHPDTRTHRLGACSAQPSQTGKEIDRGRTGDCKVPSRSIRSMKREFMCKEKSRRLFKCTNVYVEHFPHVSVYEGTARSRRGYLSSDLQSINTTLLSWPEPPFRHGICIVWVLADRLDLCEKKKKKRSTN